MFSLTEMKRHVEKAFKDTFLSVFEVAFLKICCLLENAYFFDCNNRLKERYLY